MEVSHQCLHHADQVPSYQPRPFTSTSSDETWLPTTDTATPLAYHQLTPWQPAHARDDMPGPPPWAHQPAMGWVGEAGWPNQQAAAAAQWQANHQAWSGQHADREEMSEEAVPISLYHATGGLLDTNAVMRPSSSSEIVDEEVVNTGRYEGYDIHFGYTLASAFENVYMCDEDGDGGGAAGDAGGRLALPIDCNPGPARLRGAGGPVRVRRHTHAQERTRKTMPQQPVDEEVAEASVMSGEQHESSSGCVRCCRSPPPPDLSGLSGRERHREMERWRRQRYRRILDRMRAPLPSVVEEKEGGGGGVNLQLVETGSVDAVMKGCMLDVASLLIFGCQYISYYRQSRGRVAVAKMLERVAVDKVEKAMCTRHDIEKRRSGIHINRPLNKRLLDLM